MRPLTIAALLTLAVPALAAAHVTVRPRESRAASEDRYTVRVPTEGTVATTMIRVEIPAGVTVLEVEKSAGATFETIQEGSRIVAITWRREIKPKEAAEFTFRARNPDSGQDVQWKAHQHFADGTVTDWVGAPGDRRPAAVTKIVP
jgi:uncharacterized protein YcnI